VVPVYLRWSERPVTFNRDNHPDHVIEAGQFPLVVSTVVGGVKMTKVLMDGGSGINILYKGAFEELNIEISVGGHYCTFITANYSPKTGEINKL
jgi:hypothetical protein